MADLRVLYIASPSFSGSTLLSLLLDAHPEMVSVGEVTGPINPKTGDRYPCSCGQLLRDCVFWREMQAEMTARGVNFDLNRFDTHFLTGKTLASKVRWRSLRSSTLNRLRDAVVSAIPGHRRQEARLIERNRVFAEAALAVSGKRVFVDASKDPIRIRHLSRIPNIDLRIVHLTRDARATANSFRKNTRLSPAAGARVWRRTHLEILRIAKWRKLPVLHVRYEDLCTDAPAILRAIGTFAGAAPWGGGPTATAQHVLGNRMRLGRADAIRLDESWKNELSEQEQRDVMRIAGALARELGY